MRFRERTAIRCGGGTTIMRRSGLCSSAAYDGGGAGPMAGRSWPFHGGRPQWPADFPPLVHNLEASTGRAVSSVVGLGRVGVADLDGDGLADLWGEANGQLRAFRGESPEVWRALGSFGTAREFSRWAASVVQPASRSGWRWDRRYVDRRPEGSRPHGRWMPSPATRWDRFVIRDSHGSIQRPVLRRAVERSSPARAATDTRSGRPSSIPGGSGTNAITGRSYNLAAQSLPAGDLDGDGTPDVLVQRHPGQQGTLGIKQAATLAPPGPVRPHRPMALVGGALAARISRHTVTRQSIGLSLVSSNRTARRTSSCGTVARLCRHVR